MIDDARVLLIGAMYENGGNTIHRFLDGHPEMFVYPFESQLGTRLVTDQLTSMFPVKYRWPVFALDAPPEADYAAIIDEECKVRARTPHVSKFRHVPFEFSDDERRELYVEHVRRTGRSQAANVRAFFGATFDAWRDHRSSGRESLYVGYSPVLAVDAIRILEDMPGAMFLHVVRNPWSAYADTKKRPVPLGLAQYMLGWMLNQQLALVAQRLHPDRMLIVRTEDVLAAPPAVLGEVCRRIGVERSETLSTVSWNGEPLAEVYPWGTIRSATAAANHATALELSHAEADAVRLHAGPYLEVLGFSSFLDTGEVAAPTGATPWVAES